MDPKDSETKNIHLSIFHTNDMHGYLDNIARLSTYSHMLRKKAEAEGRITFLWDAGDAADRRIEICGVTKGAAFPPILNAMGYSLQTLGNAIAVTYGPQAVPAVAKRSDFPVLAANFRNGDDPLLEGLQEYVFIDLSHELSMAVIGLTDPIGDLYEHFGFHFPDFCETTRRLVEKLRADGITVIAILSHLGLKNDRKLADTVKGIDLIVGGHSHDRLENGELRNGVLITQAGDYAKAVGRIDVSLDIQKKEITACDAVILDVPENIQPDPMVLKAIEKAEEEVEQVKAQPIGEVIESFSHDFFTECDIGNLAADALRERMHAEVAILAGGLLIQGLGPGSLTLGALNAACCTTANPWLSEVTGAQILETLERALDPTIHNAKPKANRGSPVGTPQVSGMSIRYKNDGVSGEKIDQVFINGKPIEKDQRYLVAHTDAETAPQVGYLEITEEQTIKQEVPTILREVIEDYVRKNTPVSRPKDGRWIKC